MTTNGSETSVPADETVTSDEPDIADYDGEATGKTDNESAPTEEAAAEAAATHRSTAVAEMVAHQTHHGLRRLTGLGPDPRGGVGLSEMAG